MGSEPVACSAQQRGETSCQLDPLDRGEVETAIYGSWKGGIALNLVRRMCRQAWQVRSLYLQHKCNEIGELVLCNGRCFMTHYTASWQLLFGFSRQ